MATKIELQIAEQVLVGNNRQPAAQLLQLGIKSFAGVRSRMLPIYKPALTARNGIVRCQLKRGAKLELYVGVRTFERRERSKSQDPATGLTKVVNRRVQVESPHTIARLLVRSGSNNIFDNTELLVRELAARCRGDAELVTRVCAAIERARLRCFELAEQATRWK